MRKFLSAGLMAGTFLAAYSLPHMEGGLAFHRSIIGDEQSRLEAAVMAKSASASESTPEDDSRKTPDKSSQSRSEEVIFEDFSSIPDGAQTEDGRYTTLLANEWDENGAYIDNTISLKSGDWAGHAVMAGKEGTVVLQPRTAQYPAYLSTPLGDYSGDLTITIRVRYSSPWYEWADSETGWLKGSGSDASLFFYTGGYKSTELASTDIDDPYFGLQTGRIYPNSGWVEMTYNVHNESADGDGYLKIFTSTAIEIDWVRITDSATYLAGPKTREAVDFTEDGFTINWDPVRRSFNYYIDLWQAEYTADSGIDAVYDFEDGELPEGTSAGECEVKDGAGNQNSYGLVLDYNDAAFETPEFGMSVDKFSFDARIVVPEGTSKTGSLIVEGLGENGWESAVVNPMIFMAQSYQTYVCDGELFAGVFKALRLKASGMADGQKVYIDNVKAWSPRPYELVRYEDAEHPVFDKENDDNNYNYYCVMDYQNEDTSYTFTGLDPENEYFYRVRSHYVNEFAAGEKMHALGVAAPRNVKADDIHNDSFGIVWNDVAKATGYTANIYKATEVGNDSENHMFMEEAFLESEGENDLNLLAPIGNDFECTLDDYTDLQGWRGCNNAVGMNMLGVAPFNSGWLTTPPIIGDYKGGECLVYIEAIGTAGDMLSFQLAESGLSGVATFDEYGMVSGYVNIPLPESGDRITFRTLYSMGFALTRFEVSKEVKAGDTLYVFDRESEMEAGVGHISADGLESDGLYAFNMKSVYDYEQQIVESVASPVIIVNLADGSQREVNYVESAVADTVREIGRFTVDGMPATEESRGLIIVRMSDGNARKVFIK